MHTQQVVSPDRVTTAQGSEITISATCRSVKWNHAAVIKTYIQISNGYIDVIDTIILPS